MQPERPNVISMPQRTEPGKEAPAQLVRNKRRSALMPATRQLREQIVSAWLDGSPEEAIGAVVGLRRQIVERVLHLEITSRWPTLRDQMQAQRKRCA